MTPKILYVDDELDNLVSFKAVFRRQYAILTAESAAMALKILEKEPVSIVISDQRMPKMTGVELFEQIKDLYPDTIRMVLTGYSDMQAIIDAINKGNVYQYITKPWKADELKVIIQNALETHRLREKNRELEKKNIMAQFEILKNQIQPHFLFNSMNILRSLIREEGEKAIEFATRFSKLYRSVLELKDQLLISLSEELDFIQAYIFMQKMRFEDSLTVTIDIPKEKMEYTLPPFALQILLENAIKHNVISEEAPLKIIISCENDNLIIENNLQLRGHVEDSTGTGLSNLQARYSIIGALEISIKEENEKFVISIPLIPEA